LDDKRVATLGDAFATSGGLSSVESHDRSSRSTSSCAARARGAAILHLVYARELGHDGAARNIGITATRQDACSRARLRLAHKLRHWSEVIG